MPNIDLLDLFHSRARTDRARSGLNGKLCVAIASATGVRRWVAECGPEGDRFTFVEAIPSGCDALLIAAESELQAALGGASIGADARVVIRGDASLFDAFCQRYFQSLSPLAVRASLPGVP
jgi:hypothetical protein